MKVYNLTSGRSLYDIMKDVNFSQKKLRKQEEIQKGIILHRQIDTYTDAHPLVKKGTRRLQKKHHKYAPVIVDVWYDYLLANNWSRYSSESLDDFCEGVYKILEDRINEFPTKIQQRLPMMIEHKWLQSYGTDEGIRYTFKRLSPSFAYNLSCETNLSVIPCLILIL